MPFLGVGVALPRRPLAVLDTTPPAYSTTLADRYINMTGEFIYLPFSDTSLPLQGVAGSHAAWTVYEVVEGEASAGPVVSAAELVGTDTVKLTLSTRIRGDLVGYSYTLRYQASAATITDSAAVPNELADIGSAFVGIALTNNSTYADTLAPAVPANLAATPGDTTISWNWDDSADNGTAPGPSNPVSYLVRRYIGGVYQDTVTAATSNYTWNGLTNGTSYSIDVAARDSAPVVNTSAYCTTVAATPVLAFVPTDLVPAMWVRSTVGVTVATGASALDDQSTFNRDLAQATTSMQPAVTTVGGRTVLRFDDVDDNMSRAVAGFPGTTTPTGLSFVFVGRINGINTYGPIIMVRMGDSNSPCGLIASSDGTRLAHIFFDDPDSYNYNSGPVFPAAGTRILCAATMSRDGAGNATCTLWLKAQGVAVVKVIVPGYTIASAATGTGFLYLARDTTGPRFTGMDMEEAMMWADETSTAAAFRVLSDADIANLATYFGL